MVLNVEFIPLWVRLNKQIMCRYQIFIAMYQEEAKQADLPKKQLSFENGAEGEVGKGTKPDIADSVRNYLTGGQGAEQEVKQGAEQGQEGEHSRDDK